MREIDTDESDGDSLVSLEMIVAWLKKLKLVVNTQAPTTATTPLLLRIDSLSDTPCGAQGEDQEVIDYRTLRVPDHGDDEIEGAATKIQAAHRGLTSRRWLGEQKVAATKIQSASRGHSIRRMKSSHAPRTGEDDKVSDV